MVIKLIHVVFIVSVIFYCNGFLLQNNTRGTALTDQRYFYLQGLLDQERENARQMEQFVLKLNNEMKSLQQQMSGSNPGNGCSPEMSNVINTTIVLNNSMIDIQNENKALQKELCQVKQELMEVKNDNNALNKKNIRLQSEIYIVSNDSMKLKTEVETFTKSTSAGIFKNMTQIQSRVESLEHTMDKTTAQLNVLTSRSNARDQDFLALLNQTRVAQHKIIVLDTETKQNLQKFQISTNQKIMTMLRDFQIYQNSTSNKIVKLETQTRQTLKGYQNNTKYALKALGMEIRQALQGYKISTNQKISDISESLTAINQTVVLTSCNSGTPVSDGSVVTFTRTKTVYGISDVSAFKSSGKFTCEVAGVYLFSVFIHSGTNPSGYRMYKNNDYLSFVYIVHGSNNGLNYHTGTGIVAVSLNVGDTLYVRAGYKMAIYTPSSCMTVIKIR